MSTLDSILKETRSFAPSEDFRRKAQISGMEAYNALCEQADDHYLSFWGDLARELITWKKPFSRVLDDSAAPFFKWFDDGVLNVSYNCLDRHLATDANKIAIIFEADDGEVTRVTYAELHRRVCQFANGLKSLGVKKGDRVVVYMPMGIEAVVTMQACARIGAIHSVVFGGFSAGAVRDRIQDAGASVVVTANEGLRGGKSVALKATVDEALKLEGAESVKHVVVYQRTNGGADWTDGRDVWWHKLTEGQSEACEPEWMNAEDPLFILYTSGSTGKPKGIQHSSAGYLLGAINSFRWVFDYKPNDVFWCTADVGWITGHSYVCYGPLGNGATQVIFEGVPTYPDAGRFWRMIEKHKVSIFYTAPTAIRSLIKLGADLPKQFDLSSLRVLGTVGEPINPEAWIWYYETVGGSRCPIVDTWWQTETGSAMIAPLPGAVPTKPGSCTLPLPGVIADIVDESGAQVEPGRGGFLVIKRPFPSLVRTIWNDPARFKKTYFPDEFNGQYYLAGDSANRDENGYFWIMGRIDDVLNVSGHRLGTMEIESALVSNPLVAEAAVVGKPHDVKGEAVVAFVVLKGARPEGDAAKAVAAELKNWVAHEIGKIAQPDDIRFGENLPKTRSGKIMRRLLRSIAKGEEITQDVSTLENPQILGQLQQAL
ncbi:acetate--CoA ligase [Chromobacterium subtsugae]|uniref:Acetyl-coenzyme A synthetase n=1 Tax=Chromobacterium subtsugae TaxID=251747 RepID=A0ABS7FBD7_9NEIS|nr:MULTISPECIES: acetate--CoA ligase [Chromobacterium]KUM02150.1 AMP-dependent synthetase [Chromobacterium subtsugae]KZE87192.1 acetyl-coenzyme A synthetase [Chromobacterium sp. F49]MBW7565859.1 acetate--CoA ligase [Chromobacterium subtsugae]MBW8287101.1 acetate--CoA ligase [Chromobacterium subtsugae]OBU88140.1 AMP-dependent synthetase [Chromobacterium subtsugae]